MTRYVDRRVESLERVMRFISDRNWSSVGVAMVACDGCVVDAWWFLRACGRDWIRKSHAGFERWGGLCTISPTDKEMQINNVNEQIIDLQGVKDL
jgi:hypothetical protein